MEKNLIELEYHIREICTGLYCNADFWDFYFVYYVIWFSHVFFSGLKDLADFLPASLVTIASYFSAEVTRGVWKPALMNGTDWPSPASNLSHVQQEIKNILADFNVPSLDIGKVLYDLFRSSCKYKKKLKSEIFSGGRKKVKIVWKFVVDMIDVIE